MARIMEQTTAKRAKAPDGTAVVPSPGVENHQFLTFSLGGEMYAVGILNVKEIIGYGQPMTIPMMPAYIRGVINLRGAVVPVIDLAIRFGAGQTQIAPRSCIVIVEVRNGDDTRELGIIVDAVSEVLDIPRSDVEPPPTFGANIRADFIAGVGKVAGKFVMILEIARVLSADEMAVLADVGGEAAGSAAKPH